MTMTTGTSGSSTGPGQAGSYRADLTDSRLEWNVETEFDLQPSEHLSVSSFRPSLFIPRFLKTPLLTPPAHPERSPWSSGDPVDVLATYAP